MRSNNWLIKMHALVAIIIILLLPIHAFISTWGGTTIGLLLVWKSWKEILILALLPFTIALLYNRRDITRKLWSRRINKIIVAYFTVTLVMAAISTSSSDAIVAGLLMNLRFLAVFLIAQVAVMDLNVRKIRDKFTTPLIIIIAVCISVLAIVQVAFLPYDFLSQFGYDKDATIAPYTLIDENPQATRAFATLRGPNELGSFLILPIILVIALATGGISNKGRLLSSFWQRSHWNNRCLAACAVAAISMVAVFLTGSRSAWIGLFISVITLAYFSVGSHRVLAVLKKIAIPSIAIAAVALWASINVPSVRLAVFHSSPGDASLIEGSTLQHWQATIGGVWSVLGNPLGQGVGASGPASYYNDTGATIPENYYVQIGQETGWLGLGVFMTIMYLAVYNLWKNRKEQMPKVLLSGFIGLAVISLFLHGWADDPTSMTWWGLFGLYFKDKE